MEFAWAKNIGNVFTKSIFSAAPLKKNLINAHCMTSKLKMNVTYKISMAVKKIHCNKSSEYIPRIDFVEREYE